MATMSAQDLLADLDSIVPWHLDFYQDLHRNPELGFHETRTSGLVADRLRALGYEVKTGIGPTGLVGILQNGDGPTVLARADMDALPVKEATGLPYASTVTTTDDSGVEVPVMHACGHDMHVACLLGAAQLMSEHKDGWSGTFIALLQPAEEVGTGATSMIDGGLARAIPKPDVALAQHVMGVPYDVVQCRPGPALSAADSVRITVHGKGSHGSMPHLSVDPILLASTIVLRLNAIVSRELAPGTFGIVTVGSFQAGLKSNVIPDHAVLELNLRSYDDAVRAQLRAAVERIVKAECEASGSPQPPEFEYHDAYPLTDNSPEVYEKVSAAYKEHFGDKAGEMKPATASEDFSDIPRALGVPYLMSIWGGFDPDVYAKAAAEGALNSVIPGNHSPLFAPVMEPTLRTGIQSMTVAVSAYLSPAK